MERRRSAQDFPIHGKQTTADFPAGAPTARSIAVLDTPPPDNEYDCIVQGRNVLLKVAMSTSRQTIVERMRPPLRFAVAGNCTVTATHDDLSQPGYAGVTVADVTGRGAPEAVGIENAGGAGPAIVLQDAAKKVQALNACALTIAGIAVALAPLEEIEVRSPATLDTGAALIFYEV